MVIILALAENRSDMRIASTCNVINAGTSAEWFRVVMVFGSYACGFAIAGALIGIVFRGRPRLQIAASIGVSAVVFVLLQWFFGDLSSWSWQHPIASAAYFVGPFALFFAVPTVSTSLLVGRWITRHRVASH